MPAPGSPDVGQVTPLPEASVITTLTGGDPVRFCRVLRSAKLSLSAWAVAVLQADPDDPGLTDLAYAPALAEDIGPYVDAAPQELVERAMPILDRAHQGVTSLRALGLGDRDIKRLADAAPKALLGPDAPDGAAVRAKLVEQLEKKVDPAQLRQAAADVLRRPRRRHTAPGPRLRTARGRRRRRLSLRVGEVADQPSSSSCTVFTVCLRPERPCSARRISLSRCAGSLPASRPA